MSRARSIHPVRVNIHPCTPQASAATPMAAVMVTWATSIQLPLRRRPTPDGSSTKQKGTRKAGRVYFQACIVVLYGSPPVIADRREGRERGGRRHLGEHRVVKDEHVRGEVGDAQLRERRRRDHGADDVARRHRDGEPHHPDHQRREDGGQEQVAVGELDDDGAELEPQPGERHDSHDDARRGAGCRHRQHADRARLERGGHARLVERDPRSARSGAPSPCAGRRARRRGGWPRTRR